MKQFIKELSFLIIIVPVSLVILFFVMQKTEQSRQVEKLSASIEKKELTIGSPIFGSIEKFSVEEGDVVKKNQIIARIQIIDKKDSLLLNSDVYSYTDESDYVEIKSPTDAIVIKKELDEKSTIKPQETLVTLSPLARTVIRIQTNPESNMSVYESLTLTDTNETYLYSITLMQRLPVADKEGNVYYFATFADDSDAKDFYNNQRVVIKARRPAKALTGKLEAAFSSMTNNIVSQVQKYL